MPGEQNHQILAHRYTEKDRQDLLRFLRHERFLKVIQNQQYTGTLFDGLENIVEKLLDKHRG